MNTWELKNPEFHGYNLQNSNQNPGITAADEGSARRKDILSATERAAYYELKRTLKSPSQNKLPMMSLG